MIYQRISKNWVFRQKLPLIITCSIILSACGAEGLDEPAEQENPSLGAATASTDTTANVAQKFTGELLSDGSVQLSWPSDPTAVTYQVMHDGVVIATLPATELTALVKPNNGALEISAIVIVSMDASNTITAWAAQPEIVGQALVTAEPAAPTTTDSIPVVYLPSNSASQPVVVPSAAIPTPTEVPKPAVEPLVEPVVEPVVEPLNLAPQITDTSYNCDPIVESVFFSVGDTDNFTLAVTDESPLTLTYSVDSSLDGIVDVTVGPDGIFAISALQQGDVFVWLSAEDNEGLVDEYELRVIVE